MGKRAIIVNHPPMHILHIITQQDPGGAQAHLAALLPLSQGDRRFSVAAGPEGGPHMEQVVRAAGVTFYSLKYLTRRIHPPSDWQAFGELRHLIRTVNPDIVHTHSSKAGILASLACWGLRPRPRVVSTIHGWVFLEPISWPLRTLYLLLEKIAACFRTATIVLSEQDRAVALRHHLSSPQNLHVIPNGIAERSHDRTKARQTLATLRIPENAIIIACVANGYKTKNVAGLCNAFIATANELPQSHLVLIGSGGEEEKRIAEATARLPLRIHRLGWRSDAALLLDGCDLFVLPSRKEGLPFALLEAMEAGLPCLATSVGGIPQVIAHGMNGWITDPDHLAESLREVWKKQNEWPRIGATARETVHNLFSLTQMQSRTAALYDHFRSATRTA